MGPWARSGDRRCINLLGGTDPGLCGGLCWQWSVSRSLNSPVQILKHISVNVRPRLGRPALLRLGVARGECGKRCGEQCRENKTQPRLLTILDILQHSCSIDNLVYRPSAGTGCVMWRRSVSSAPARAPDWAWPRATATSWSLLMEIGSPS